MSFDLGEAGFTLDESTAHHRATYKDKQPFSLTYTQRVNLEAQTHLSEMFLVVGRKPDNLEGPTLAVGEQANSTQQRSTVGFKSRTYLL